MADDAPILHDDLFTAGVEPKPTKPSNIAKRVVLHTRATSRPASRKPMSSSRAATPPSRCIRPISSRMPASCSYGADGQMHDLQLEPGPLHGARLRARSCSASTSPTSACTPAEIGGGFGGKTLVYLEPVALALSKKSGRPVKMLMTREEVFRASGPTSGATIEVKIGAKKDGTIVAAKHVLKYQAGAFPGSPIGPGCMCGFAMYDIPNVEVIGYDVVSNRPKVAAYRAPGAPISSFAVESALDELARKLRHGPDRRCARRTRAKNGTKTALRADAPEYRLPGRRWRRRRPRALEVAAEAGPGPRHRLRLLVQHRRRVVAPRCTSTRTARSASSSGSPDIGGSRASIGDDGGRGAAASRPSKVRTIVADTASIGFTHPDRRQPRHLRHRHGGDAGGREGGRSAQAARRDDLGHHPRCGGLAGRRGVPGRHQRRRVRAAVAGRDRAEGGAHRRADHRRGVGQRAGRRPRLRRAYLRRRGGQGDRPGHDRCATPRCRMSAARSTRATWRARSRAAPRRASAGR